MIKLYCMKRKIFYKKTKEVKGVRIQSDGLIFCLNVDNIVICTENCKRLADNYI